MLENLSCKILTHVFGQWQLLNDGGGGGGGGAGGATPPLTPLIILH